MIITCHVCSKFHPWKINISLENPFVFYLFVTNLLACISKSVLATYGGFVGGGHILYCILPSISDVATITSAQDILVLKLICDYQMKWCELLIFRKHWSFASGTLYCSIRIWSDWCVCERCGDYFETKLYFKVAHILSAFVAAHLVHFAIE